MSIYALWRLGVVRTETTQVAETVFLAITICTVLDFCLNFLPYDPSLCLMQNVV